MRAKKFYIETWKSTIYVACPARSSELKKFLKRSLNTECELKDDWEGVCIDTQGKGIVIALEKWSRTPDGIATLAHECHHAAESILVARGVGHCEESREVFAYLTESIMRRCMRILNKK